MHPFPSLQVIIAQFLRKKTQQVPTITLKDLTLTVCPFASCSVPRPKVSSEANCKFLIASSAWEAIFARRSSTSWLPPLCFKWNCRSAIFFFCLFITLICLVTLLCKRDILDSYILSPSIISSSLRSCWGCIKSDRLKTFFENNKSYNL